MSTAALVIVAIATLTVIILTVVISMLFISQPSGPVTVKTALSEPRPAATALFWSENLRNNKNFEGFPPCYNTDTSAKNVFSILQRLNYVQRYYTLLDIMSILLCLKEEQSRQCNQRDVKDRLVQVLGMGGNPNDEESKKKAAAFIPVNETLQSKLIVAALDLCERQVKVMRGDASVSKIDADQISGHVYSFYVSNLATIYKACLGSNT